MDGLQVPAAWHWSRAEQTTPAHRLPVVPELPPVIPEPEEPDVIPAPLELPVEVPVLLTEDDKAAEELAPAPDEAAAPPDEEFTAPDVPVPPWLEAPAPLEDAADAAPPDTDEDTVDDEVEAPDEPADDEAPDGADDA